MFLPRVITPGIYMMTFRCSTPTIAEISLLSLPVYLIGWSCEGPTMYPVDSHSMCRIDPRPAWRPQGIIHGNVLDFTRRTEGPWMAIGVPPKHGRMITFLGKTMKNSSSAFSFPTFPEGKGMDPYGSHSAVKGKKHQSLGTIDGSQIWRVSTVSTTIRVAEEPHRDGDPEEHFGASWFWLPETTWIATWILLSESNESITEPMYMQFAPSCWWFYGFEAPNGGLTHTTFGSKTLK